MREKKNAFHTCYQPGSWDIQILILLKAVPPRHTKSSNFNPVRISKKIAILHKNLVRFSKFSHVPFRMAYKKFYIIIDHYINL